MGQTLTHGVYLPDEGERNCYSGLASNWSILDGAVGTIAEHTSALSGKAPLVHTHSKSDITDFPAYGNAAGTICEGNDSRLSDARTPVAHTHGKSDVTDLFNSANTWTEDNIFNKPIQIQKTSGATEIEIKNLNVDITNNTTTSEVDDIRFLDKNAKITGGVRLTYGNTQVTQRVYARSYSSNGESYAQVALELKSDQQNNIKEATISSNLLPATNNTYDLGSSSYQWNNLYAKKTYTDTIKAVTGSIVIQSNGTDKNIGIYNGDSATDGGGFWAYGKDHSNGSLCRIQIYNTSKSRYERVDLANSQFFPVSSGEIDLGTSTNKWKTFNGINPGALSLPSGGTTENTDWFNVTGDILPIGGNTTNFNWGQNFFTPSKDGWLALTIIQCSSISVWCSTLRYGMSVAAPDTSLNRQLIVPVVANMVYEIRISGNSWSSARLIMPKGNV